MCTLHACLNGLGFPMALIFSTLLVKLLRIYRIFNVRRKVGKLTSSDSALALYVLLFAAPNAIICVLWVVSDPYTSTVSFSVENGFLVVTVLCVSKCVLVWVLLLLAYFIAMAVLLVIFSVLTCKVKYKDFKDTKKFIMLSFYLILTCVSALFYWLRII